MNPVALPLAAIVVMLWIIWSDSVRRRRLSPIFYIARTILFLTMAGVLLYNLISDPAVYPGGAGAVMIAAVAVGLVGAGYFVRRAMRS
jgi:hypothetical protein